MSDWVPAGAVLLAVAGLLSSWLQSLAYDRKHRQPHPPAAE